MVENDNYDSNASKSINIGHSSGWKDLCPSDVYPCWMSACIPPLLVRILRVKGWFKVLGKQGEVVEAAGSITVVVVSCFSHLF